VTIACRRRLRTFAPSWHRDRSDWIATLAGERRCKHCACGPMRSKPLATSGTVQAVFSAPADGWLGRIDHRDLKGILAAANMQCLRRLGPAGAMAEAPALKKRLCRIKK